MLKSIILESVIVFFSVPLSGQHSTNVIYPPTITGSVFARRDKRNIPFKCPFLSDTSVCVSPSSNLNLRASVYKCVLLHILCVRPGPVLLSVMHNWAWLTEQYFPSRSSFS